MTEHASIRAILWDFGGVITTSPFDSFALYETEAGLPAGFIRGLNTRNSDSNAWARFERSEIEREHFCELFEAEALEAGHRVDARRVLAGLAGEPRPEMVAALRALRERYRLACLTNDVKAIERPKELAAKITEIMPLFHEVVRSSEVGVRKPEKAFYAIACERLGVQPNEAVFLDDLGVNLKTARELGMHTIKVSGARTALAALEGILGHPIARESVS